MNPIKGLLRLSIRKRLPAVLLSSIICWLFVSSLSAETQSPKKAALLKIRIAANGRTFVTDDGKPFVPMGVNYYRPGTGWAPQLWKQFDAEATRRDFARMKSLGVNCVRVFLSYGSFFMTPDALMPEGLAKFDQFLAMAEEAGIYVHPTGPDHWEGLPAWARGDRVADDRVLAALENFWRQFAGRYRGRAVIFAYDLRNEPAVPWQDADMLVKWNRWLETQYGSAAQTARAWGVAPETIQWGRQPAPQDALGNRQLLDYQHFREWLADEWTRRQTAVVKAVDPQALVTVGLLQISVPVGASHVRSYPAFRPQRQAKFLDFLEIHFYPRMAGYVDREVQRNLACLESIVREVAAPGKPVVVAEFGYYGGGTVATPQSTSPLVTEEQQARWCRKLIETSRGFAAGWLNWGLYDHPEASDCAQRSGLLTVDGKLKVWGSEFQELAKSLAVEDFSRPPKLGPRPALDWDACLTSSAAQLRFREEYDKAFEANH